MARGSLLGAKEPWSRMLCVAPLATAAGEVGCKTAREIALALPADLARDPLDCEILQFGF